MKDRVKKDLEFIGQYIKASNAATGSKYDANANVASKNVATLAAELHKKKNIDINREMMWDGLNKKYGKELADEYIRQLNSHEIYKHDETASPGTPYCVSISMYPFLFDGLTKLGGGSTAPQNLQSFNGSFINLIYLISSQFAGAVASVEYLLYTDYFIRKEFGDDYYNRLDEIVYKSNYKKYTVKQIIEDGFQQVVYSMNQPAAARGFQSVFWNISYFDKYYFEGMFSDFVFPDGTEPLWESLNELQKVFMKWFNNERKKAVLTFPVETLSLLHDEKGIVDTEWRDFAAEMLEEGHSFFVYTSDTVDSLASCCRLRNEFVDNTFSYSLGAGGTMTGSKNVITININRLVQNVHSEWTDATKKGLYSKSFYSLLQERLTEQVEKIHKYHIVFNDNIKSVEAAGMLPVYDAGFIELDKQYLTIGINGMLEGAEYLGITPLPNKEYKEYINTILKPIFEANKAAKTTEHMFNTELVPAENLGVKHANWDREDGYFVPRKVYNSYLYVVEDEETNILDKINLHNGETLSLLDGGSAAHLNLDEHLSAEQYSYLLEHAARTGCNYFTFNIPNTICNECNHISKHNLDNCPNCNSQDVDKLTRIIGYLKRVSNFSEPRQVEAHQRYYAKDI